jgi:hypothetical protein
MKLLRIATLLACLIPLAATAMEMPEPKPEDPAEVLFSEAAGPKALSLKEIVCKHLLDQFKSDTASNKNLIALLNKIKFLPADLKEAMKEYLFKYYAEFLESINDSQPLLLVDELADRYFVIRILDESHLFVYANYYNLTWSFIIVNYVNNTTFNKMALGGFGQTIVLPNKRFVALCCGNGVSDCLHIIDLESKKICKFWEQQEPDQEAYFTKDGLSIAKSHTNTTVQVTTIALDENFYAHILKAEEMDLINHQNLTKTVTILDMDTYVKERIMRLGQRFKEIRKDEFAEEYYATNNNNNNAPPITANTAIGFVRYGKTLVCYDHFQGAKKSQSQTFLLGSFTRYAQHPCALSPGQEYVFFRDGKCLYKYATHKTLLKDSTIEELLALIIAQKEHITHKKLDPYVWNILNSSKNYHIKEILNERYAPLQPQESVASLLAHHENVEDEEEVEEIDEESQTLLGCPIS